MLYSLHVHIRSTLYFWSKTFRVNWSITTPHVLNSARQISNVHLHLPWLVHMIITCTYATIFVIEMTCMVKVSVKLNRQAPCLSASQCAYACKAQTGFIKWQAGLLISKRQNQWSDAENCRQILLKPEIFRTEISLWASLCHALCAHNANADWFHCRFASHRRLTNHFVNRWGWASGQVILGLSLLYVS